MVIIGSVPTRWMPTSSAPGTLAASAAARPKWASVDLFMMAVCMTSSGEISEGWSTPEMNRIRAAKAEYQKKLKEESIETGNEEIY